MEVNGGFSSLDFSEYVPRGASVRMGEAQLVVLW